MSLPSTGTLRTADHEVQPYGEDAIVSIDGRITGKRDCIRCGRGVPENIAVREYEQEMTCFQKVMEAAALRP